MLNSLIIILQKFEIFFYEQLEIVRKKNLKYLFGWVRKGRIWMSSNHASRWQIWWHLDCRTRPITSSFVVNMAQATSHPKTPCTCNWAREDPMRFHTQLQSPLKGAFMLVFSINYSMCHPGQLAAVNWIWQVNLRALFTDCTRELGWAKELPKTENRSL